MDEPQSLTGLGGSSGDAVMFSNLRQSSPFDGILIDYRNERPLTVALATILAVWSLAFALTFASGHGSANHTPVAVTSSMGK
jgi:hypothetical protein